MKGLVTTKPWPAHHHQHWDWGALAEFNFPSANGFQSPNCYQDDSGEQNTNYLRAPRQTPALTSPACKFQSQPFKWQLCKQQKLLNYHRSQWCYSQEKCYWRRQQNGAKGGGDTDIKKFSLVIHECQARASHSLGNVTFFFDFFLSWISTVNKSQCRGKALCARKSGSFGC